MGLETSEDKIVICFTNRKCDLDSALQGRFSKTFRFRIMYLHSRIPTYRRYTKHLKVKGLTVSGTKQEFYWKR